MTPSRPIYLAIALIFLTGIAFAQTTVYNNFGPDHNGWDYNYGLGWTVAGVTVASQYGVEQAMGFQSTASGTVSDIWVAFFYVPLDPGFDQVTIMLARNPLGLPPDSADVMESWTITDFESWTQWNPPIHLTGTGASSLEEGGSYWLWATGDSTTWTGWCMNIDPSLTCPHTLRREGENWLGISQETASAFRVDVIEATPITVTLTPLMTPIQIPANGGIFDYNILVENSGIIPVTVDFWAMATLPNGSEYGPLLLVQNFNLAAGQIVDRDRSQSVPGNAPTGMYSYDAYIGTYPDQIIDEDHFDWEKLPVNDSGLEVQEWFCSGDGFDDGQWDVLKGIPDGFTTLEAYPNPFNPSTVLSYKLQVASHVNLSVYDVTGSTVATLIDGFHDIGIHEVTFDGNDLPSGIYFARLTAGEFVQTQKLVLMK